MMRAVRLGVCALVFVLPFGIARTAVAQTSSETTDAEAEPLTEEQKSAREHFEKAKMLYQTGAYREAIGELQRARALDPKAKDLVFNLGLVSERLGAYDDAITYLQQYTAMDTVTDAERTKAESMIRRIEGAKRESAEKRTAAQGSQEEGAKSEDKEEHPSTDTKPRHGRIDAATITAASVAVVGLGVGTAFGIRALSLDTSGFVTGRDGSYQDLQQRTDDAHTSAIVADIGFGVGALAAVVTAYLYFGRTKTPSSKVTASASPLPGGGAFVLGGVFQ